MTAPDQPGEHHNQEQVQAALAWVTDFPECTEAQMNALLALRDPGTDLDNATSVAAYLLAAHCRRLEQRVAEMDHAIVQVPEGSEFSLDDYHRTVEQARARAESAEAALAAAQARITELEEEPSIAEKLRVHFRYMEMEKQLAALKESLGAAQKDTDQIAYAVGRAGHALVKTEYGYELIKGPFKALGNEPLLDDGIYGA